MLLEINGITFKTLPHVWSNKSIFPALTYDQCVELEAYWKTHHGVGKPSPPIPYSFWVVLKNVMKNWREAQAKYNACGLPKITKKSRF